MPISKINKVPAVLTAGVFIVGTVLIYLSTFRYWLPAVLAVVLLAGFKYRSRLSTLVQAVYVGLLLATVCGYTLSTLNMMRINIQNPPRWDFEVFWLNGRVGAGGYNPYEAEAFYEVAARDLGTEATTDTAFQEEVLDPAFLYPPPTMFLFLPLGWLDISPALALWYVIQSVFLVGSIVLLWKIFFPADGWLGLLLSAALTLIMYGTQSTIQFAQLNIMMLFFALLFLRDHERSRAGIWLALGILVKPLVGAIGLYSLVRGQWKVIGVMLLTFIVLGVLSALAFGGDTIVTYFTHNPAGRVPTWLYEEIFYQSILTFTVRVTNFDFTQGSAYFHPLFLLLAGIVFGLTAFLTYRIRAHAHLAVALCMTAGLLLYPHTQIYYTVLLIIPILVVWKTPERASRDIWIKLGFIALVYLLAQYQSGTITLLANVVSWLMMVLLSFLVLNDSRESVRANLASMPS
jgi:hypothetical protein